MTTCWTSYIARLGVQMAMSMYEVRDSRERVGLQKCPPSCPRLESSSLNVLFLTDPITCSAPKIRRDSLAKFRSAEPFPHDGELCSKSFTTRPPSILAYSLV